MPKARSGEHLAEPTELMKMRAEAGRRRMQYKEHDQITDLMLVEEYRDGNENAMMELIDRYSDVIYFAYNNPAKLPGQKIAKNLSFSFTPEDKEDLWNCAILNFVDLVTHYDEEKGPLEYYVRGTLRYRVFNEFFQVEMEKIINESDKELDDQFISEFKSIFIEDADYVPSNYIELYQAMNTLTIRQKQIFEMQVVNGWSHAEVAKELGISAGTVMNTKNTVVRKLQKYLDKIEE